MPSIPTFAHRGLPGRWQNSLRGVRTALELGYRGFEVDVLLTRDDVPVLSHDPWLHPELVRHADGRAVSGRTLVRSLSLAQLERGFRFACAHPEHPGEAGPEEGPCTLESVLQLALDRPEVAVYLDLKIERPKRALTASPRRTAEAVFRAVREVGLTNPLYVDGGSGTILQRLREAAGAQAFHSVLSYPRFDAGVNDTLEAVGAGVRGVLSPRGPARAGRRAGADHLAMAAQVTTQAVVEAASEAACPAILFGIGDRDALEAHGSWPLAGVIVDDHPSLRPRAC